MPGVAGASGSAYAAWGGHTLSDAFADFFQQHYRRMSPDEINDSIERIERKARKRYGIDIDCENTPPIEGVVFGYALNISKCRGYRDCVHACVEENNLSSDTQYIRVIEMDQGSTNLHAGLEQPADHSAVMRFGKEADDVLCHHRSDVAHLLQGFDIGLHQRPEITERLRQQPRRRLSDGRCGADDEHPSHASSRVTRRQKLEEKTGSMKGRSCRYFAWRSFGNCSITRPMTPSCCRSYWSGSRN